MSLCIFLGRLLTQRVSEQQFQFVRFNSKVFVKRGPLASFSREISKPRMSANKRKSSVFISVYLCVFAAYRFSLG